MIIRADRSARFVCPWNLDLEWNTNRWSFDRALDAYHVYAHFYVYYGALLDQKVGDRAALEERIVARRKASYDKAVILRKWLLDNEAMHMGGGRARLYRAFE